MKPQDQIQSRTLTWVFIFLLIASGNLSAQDGNLTTIEFDGKTIQVFPTDHPQRLPWGPANNTSGANSTHDGRLNTQTIIDKYAGWNNGNYAAGICAQLNAYGYDDWYLPSATEMAHIFGNRNKIQGLYQSSIYWTSTEEHWGSDAAAIDLASGIILYRYKDEMNRVRCVRSISFKDKNNGVYLEDDYRPIGLLNTRVTQINLKDPNHGHIPVFSYYGVQSGLIKYNRTGIEQLRHYSTRKDSYTSVLRAIALQPDFDASSLTNLFLPFITTEGLLDDETLAFLVNVVFSTTNFSVSLADQLAHMDLRYVKSVDGYTRALNNMKTLGRKLDRASVKNFSTALSYFSIITNSISLYNDAAYIASSAALINAAQVDMGLIRLHHLKSLNIMSDPAYNDALLEVISELEALPESYWQRLFFSIRDNQDKLASAAISLAAIANEVSILIDYNPIGGWIRAGLFTVRTYNLITDWRENFRQLTCAATIYMNLNHLGERQYTLEDEEVMDFASLLYFRGMKTMTDNFYIRAWEFIDADRLAFRINLTEEYENVYNIISLKRINRIKNFFHKQVGYRDDSMMEQTVFNGTQIVDVINPATGKTWMDRNLGASRAATSSTDAEAYGDLYQWGRAADGHQKRNSGTTRTLSNSDTPGHGNFILISSGAKNNWRSPQHDNLWQGVNGINNPCPAGYRLPTEAELNAERLSWSSNNAAGAFASPLKLPMAGYRQFRIGSLYNVGSGGYYWSSSVDSSTSRSLCFSSENARVGSYVRAFGDSVRCIKD